MQENVWQLFIRDGVSKLTADLHTLQLSGITMTGGASEVALRLPSPTGIVAIRIAGRTVLGQNFERQLVRPPIAVGSTEQGPQRRTLFARTTMQRITRLRVHAQFLHFNGGTLGVALQTVK